MQLYSEQSVTSQTAYAQVVEVATTREIQRSVHNLLGSFCKKTVRGKLYWYFQHPDISGKLRQIYIGPDSPEMSEWVQQASIQTLADEQLGRLVKSALSLNCVPVLGKHHRVLAKLCDYGFFKAGGVLVGTHAFLAYANLLGVHWKDGAATQDIDFAHAGKNVSIALPSNLEMNVMDAIESLNMGFIPAPSLSDKLGATYLTPSEPDFRLDFLTVQTDRSGAVFLHPQLHIPLQPLRFMEFSLEGIMQGVLLSTLGAVVVNIPAPARYALHKLIVYGEREGAFRVKSLKDLQQAAALIEVLENSRPWELQEAWQDLLGRGKGWVQRAMRGISALKKRYPFLELSFLES